MDALTVFFNQLWLQYTAITPQALAIEHLFQQRGEIPVNDHVAFRTYSDSKIDISHLEKHILNLGYQPLDDYNFEAKKLVARCYIHNESPTKIFISELQWKKLSASSQGIISNLIDQIDDTIAISMSCGRVWPLPTFSHYQTLLAESEYAAWLSVWGLRANHFTIFVNCLKHCENLSEVVNLLVEQGYVLNSQGGVIKGTEQDNLIQASTLADKIDVSFSDVGKKYISSCYYEFAQRFKQDDGSLFQGFVPQSADKIFESTNMKPSVK